MTPATTRQPETPPPTRPPPPPMREEQPPPPPLRGNLQKRSTGILPWNPWKATIHPWKVATHQTRTRWVYTRVTSTPPPTPLRVTTTTPPHLGIVRTDTTNPNHMRMWNQTRCRILLNRLRRSTTTKSTLPRRCPGNHTSLPPSPQCLMLNPCLSTTHHIGKRNTTL